jgi:hypothetical protein
LKKDSFYSHDDAAQAVEYLLEDEIQDENFDQEIIYKEVSEADLQQDDGDVANENELSGDYQEYIETEEETNADKYTAKKFNCRADNDTDAWLCSVKYALLKLSKLNQAQAKRDINNIISKYEIDELQSEKC